jgi:hypothetical protein
MPRCARAPTCKPNANLDRNFSSKFLIAARAPNRRPLPGVLYTPSTAPRIEAASHFDNWAEAFFPRLLEGLSV